MTDKPNIIELPIDQSEQARQPERKNLLAQEVYEKIAEHLERSHDQLKVYSKKSNVEFDESRSHQAILIDGGRGTGKSSVLVNLSTYLSDEKDYLILKPVDPTLLEKGDDLLLNVIVAALMRDKSVRLALLDKEKLAEDFYEQLHKLGNALEGIQKQKEQYGLDKLRSFMGNQGLAELIHELLQKTLELTGKKLIVLPIDDVDTSLQLAFENIEVLRKYLTSPYIVPIISGDLSLYNEVIWREFYGRLTNGAKATVEHAQNQARDLAEEYQRKVLPLPRRIQLPQLSTYLKARNIILKNGEEILPLHIFRSWLDALLNERVNGEENSQLNIPLNTVREMTQFINATQALIPELKKYLPIKTLSSNPDTQEIIIKRLTFMNQNIAQHVADFEREYREAFYLTSSTTSKNRRGRNAAYLKLAKSVSEFDSSPDINYIHFKTKWYSAIADYFFYQRKNATAFLVAKTNTEWLDEKIRNSTTSVLDHDLFQPLNHQDKKLEHFETTSEIKTEWVKALDAFVPEVWLERLPKKSLLPYPVPEKGSSIWSTIYSGPWAFDDYVSDNASEEHQYTQLGEAELVRQMMTHWSFYSTSKQSNLVLTGRLFEFIITSLIRDLDPIVVMQLFNSPPFYSVISLASTKTFNMEDESAENDEKPYSAELDTEEKDDAFKKAVADLVENVNSWRSQHDIQPPHSWLIYNVMNKTFNQINQTNWQPKLSETPATKLKTIAGTAIKAYHTVWAAFGSFEKGEAFGFPRIIANVNMSEADKNFEQNELYRQNILPFLQTNETGEILNLRTNSYTFALDSHPLRHLINSVFDSINANNKQEEIRNTPIARRLDRIFNATARSLNLEINRASILKLSIETLESLLGNVYSQCKTEALQEEFHYVQNNSNFPTRSGRQYLKYCLNRHAALVKKATPNDHKS